MLLSQHAALPYRITVGVALGLMTCIMPMTVAGNWERTDDSSTDIRAPRAEDSKISALRIKVGKLSAAAKEAESAYQKAAAAAESLLTQSESSKDEDRIALEARSDERLAMAGKLMFKWQSLESALMYDRRRLENLKEVIQLRSQIRQQELRKSKKQTDVQGLESEWDVLRAKLLNAEIVARLARGIAKDLRKMKEMLGETDSGDIEKNGQRERGESSTPAIDASDAPVTSASKKARNLRLGTGRK